MDIALINLKRPQHTTPGIAEKVFIALVDWFVEPGGIKSPGPYVNFGDSVIISQAHELKPGYAFIECTLAPEKNSYDAKGVGDTGFLKFENKLTVVFPGSYPELHETIKGLLNQPVIVLIKDSNCEWNTFYQIGTSCVYAYTGATFTTGTTKDGFKGYLLEVSNTAGKVYLYQAIVPGTPRPLIARINGSIAGTTVTLDALESDISGNVNYEYTVIYNDNADAQQMITLPDNSFDASFDTSILTGWNNAGFAVKLKIENEWGSDTTLSSDSTGERPLDMGGFDQGFDEGFDFNY